MPSRPAMKPPVGKSGPGRSFIISLSEASGLSIISTVASLISRKLCGGMVVAMAWADYVAAVAVGLGEGGPESDHAVENATMDSLETVADVGQSASDDDAHGVVEIRLAHLGFDVHRKNYGLRCFVRHFPSLLQ